MGKIESNKLQKQTSLLNTAFHLFTTKGVNKTSIAEISKEAGIAKGTFYLYFKDKYDIRNKLISHESNKLFQNAAEALEKYKETHQTLSFEDQIVFIVGHIVNILNKNRTLLTFISKNLSWGIFKEALEMKTSDDDIDFRQAFYKLISQTGIRIREPEIMLFMITELVSSTCYNSILFEEPVGIDGLKPYLYSSIRAIIKSHEITD